MTLQVSDRIHTSNDLLRRLMAKHASCYQVIVQSAEDVQNIENAPAFSVEPYLNESGQASLLRTISIYSHRGDNCEQTRLLYMNAAAMRVWRQMGNAPKIIGTQARPPDAAILTLGVPFSE